MKKIGLFFSLVLGLSLSLALLWFFGALKAFAVAAEYARIPSTPANELRVCPSGPPACQYTSIQTAVDSASPGDVIKIATGTYADVHSRPAPPGYPYPYGEPTEVVTQVVYISKTITIRGGYTAPDFAEPPHPEQNPATLDAQLQGHGIFITGDINPTIEGLRITGGGVEGQICMDLEPGGGVYVGSTAATIHDNRIFGNRGGGLFVRHSTAMVSGNIVNDNEACDGAGLNLDGSNATISDNLFSTNDATAFGGGISMYRSVVTLTNNLVIDNIASWGGGILFDESDATLINNVVVDNQVVEGGSALSFWGGSYHLLHNTIVHNTGGDGSGIRTADIFEEGIDSTVSMSNTILASHMVGINATDSSTVTVNGILWHNTPTTVSHSPSATVLVQNQHTGGPAFAADGYHLTSGSAAIDKGINAGIIVDIDGELRPAGAGYDLGADEFWHRINLPLVLRNQ